MYICTIKNYKREHTSSNFVYMTDFEEDLERLEVTKGKMIHQEIRIYQFLIKHPEITK